MRPCRLALGLVLAVLAVSPAHAVIVVTQPGVTCANDPRLTTPVVGRDVCFDSTQNLWFAYSGTGTTWDAITARVGTGAANTIPRFTGVGGNLTASALSDNGTTVTSSRPVTV